MNNKKLWISGEAQAAEYLTNKKYKIIGTNVKMRSGEADIIAFAPDGTLVFVEVKSRSSAAFGYPREAVNVFKQRKYVMLAKEYIVWKRYADKNVRFDVIEIMGGDIEHIENAFQA